MVDLLKGTSMKVLTTLVLTNHLLSSSFKTTVGQFQLPVSYKQLPNISSKAKLLLVSLVDPSWWYGPISSLRCNQKVREYAAAGTVLC